MIRKQSKQKKTLKHYLKKNKIQQQEGADPGRHRVLIEAFTAPAAVPKPVSPPRPARRGGQGAARGGAGAPAGA